jgi:flavin reductase (DIM6/NTAB) family NADH-FMN oxidoreductase RutF
MLEKDGVNAAEDAFTSSVDYPLTVITVGGGDAKSGCLVGFVTQCSIAPFRLLACISKLNHTYRVALGSPGIAVHLLGREQEHLAKLFADESGDTVDKFEYCLWHQGLGGAPILEECTAWVDGRILTRFDAGDHDAFLIEPLAGGKRDHRELLTFRESPDFQPAHPAGA